MEERKEVSSIELWGREGMGRGQILTNVI